MLAVHFFQNFTFFSLSYATVYGRCAQFKISYVYKKKKKKTLLNIRKIWYDNNGGKNEGCSGK